MNAFESIKRALRNNGPMSDSELSISTGYSVNTIRRERKQMEDGNVVTFVDNNGPRRALRVQLSAGR